MTSGPANRSRSLLVATVLAAGSVVALPGTVTTARAQSVTVYEGEQWKFKIEVDPEAVKEAAKELWKVGQKVYRRLLTDHPERKVVFEINGYKVVLVEITSQAGGTRLTNNIDFNEVWNTDPDVRIFVAASKGDPNAMAFQLKKDVDWGSDENKSENNLRHGVRIKKFSAGSRRYFANRSDTVHWGGYLIIADARLSKEDLAGIPGVTIH